MKPTTCKQCGEPIVRGRWDTPANRNICDACAAFACGDCDPCIGGRPDQCAVMNFSAVTNTKTKPKGEE